MSDPSAKGEEVDLLNEKDLYKILGVSRSAKADELKKAYRQKSLRYHPDKNPSPDAKPIFQKITEAYSILSDNKKRLKYDKSGDMDLEDFDIDQFLNMWVGEMMEDGGVVDDMMQSVLPWSNDDDKMIQFMEENVQSSGAKIKCLICGHVGSNKRLMLAHFEKKHQFECEEWAQETLKSMKASFESFMKQVTGIGDSTGEFLMPDGTTADMSKVPGVPNIRAHMQKRIDKAKELDQVLEMYRSQQGAQELAKGAEAPMPEAKKISEVLRISLEEAEALKDDRGALLKLLAVRINDLNEEEEDDDEDFPPFLDGFGDFGGGGLDGLLGGLGGMPGGPGLDGLKDLQDLLAEADADPALLAGLGDMEGLLGGLGSLGPRGPGGIGGIARGSQDPYAALAPRPPRSNRRPVMEDSDEPEIGCICGYTCGTEKALQRHFDRFPADPSHARK